MTDNQIIKALQEWSERGMAFCNIGMPEFARLILNLINRQKEEIKTEAIKEFAEKLKNRSLTKWDYCEAVDVEEINNLVKEMTGDTE